MGFLDPLKSIFAGGGEQQDDGYYIYVRCRRCGEVIKTRLSLLNDLSMADSGGYVVHKTLIGNQLCFERIEVTLTFDEHRRLVDRQISRGEFITAEDYQAAQPG
jgi:hypothetical protein